MIKVTVGGQDVALDISRTLAQSGIRPGSTLKLKLRDEVSATAMALEIECRQLMAEAEVADFVKGARLSKTDVLLSFIEGTRRVRKRLAF